MKRAPSDTRPLRDIIEEAADSLDFAKLRAEAHLSPAQKLQQMFELCEQERQKVFGEEQAKHPDESDELIWRHVRDRILEQQDLSNKVRADLKNGFAGTKMNPLPFDLTKLIELCRRNDVAKIGVFGSTARGDMRETSDIDLLVYFSKRKSLLAHLALERQMSEALGRKVDLLTEAALSPYLRESILREVRVLYEA